MLDARCNTQAAEKAPADRVDARVIDLLRQAAQWRLLGRLFERPTDAWRCDVAALAVEVDDAALATATTSALATASDGLYHSVFGPGGPASVREVSYHETVELGSLMSDLAGYYSAFGYDPSTGEPPDHVAVEVGFVSYLYFKEAYALVAANTERVETTAKAAASFRIDHLARMAKPLAVALADSDIDYLAQASALLSTRVGGPRDRMRLPVIQTSLDDHGCMFGCGDP